MSPVGSAIAIEYPQTEQYQTDEDRWQAAKNRDPRADGAFFLAVKTTGIYCRPSCAARTPLHKNVSFYETSESAQLAGFRACKRCKPDRIGTADDLTALIAEACRNIETAEELPSLKALAERAGYSPYHFHRLFKRHTGVTPKAYAQAHRSRRIKAELQTGGAVTDAIYEAGYQAGSRFYEESKERLGMTATQYQRGGAGQTLRYTIATCSFGHILIAATEKGICTIQFGEGAEEMRQQLRAQYPRAELTEGEHHFGAWVREVLDALEQGRLPSRELPLDIQGTAFQQQVWRALREIPDGETRTYAAVAAQIGRPKAVRAVANACAGNNLAIAIPCHRVIRADGSTSGYRWGSARKQAILDREAKT